MALGLCVHHHIPLDLALLGSLAEDHQLATVRAAIRAVVQVTNRAEASQVNSHSMPAAPMMKAVTAVEEAMAGLLVAVMWPVLAASTRGRGRGRTVAGIPRGAGNRAAVRVAAALVLTAIVAAARAEARAATAALEGERRARVLRRRSNPRCPPASLHFSQGCRGVTLTASTAVKYLRRSGKKSSVASTSTKHSRVRIWRGMRKRGEGRGNSMRRRMRRIMSWRKRGGGWR
mmetsp:Transcript_10837/g.28963  ORF Transcript_10837/g.28963 Transcript_10837/m.28963 type:complete len:231 (-) Transcript_10837:191-883(-)